MNEEVNSIYDIAKIANVSPSTVSKVINNRKDIGAKTRKLVMGIINESNFKPKISNSFQDTVGFFLPMGTTRDTSSYYIQQVFNGIALEALAHSQNVVFSDISFLPRDPDMFKIYCNIHCIHSAIFALLSPVHEYVTKFGDVLPVVLIGSNFNAGNCYKVNSENKAVAEKAVSFIIEKGHKKIYHITYMKVLSDHLERYRGYEDALRKANLKSAGVYDVFEKSDIDMIMHFKDLFSNKEDAPTALFCSSDTVASSVISCLKLIGVSVPDDVSVMGWDDNQYAVHISPALTTVRQPEKRLGEIASSMVIHKYINKSEPDMKEIILNSELVIRESVTAPKRLS